MSKGNPNCCCYFSTVEFIERRWVTCTVVVLLRYVRNNLRRSLIRSSQSLAVPVTGLAPYARVPCPNAKLCAACNNLRNTEYTVIYQNLRNFRPASIESEAEKSIGLQCHYFSKLNHQRVIIDDSYPPPLHAVRNSDGTW